MTDTTELVRHLRGAAEHMMAAADEMQALAIGAVGPERDRRAIERRAKALRTEAAQLFTFCRGMEASRA